MASDLPNGGFILTKGSTYLLDGFQFDEEPSGGVLESARLPETKGLAGLPEGFLAEDGLPPSSSLPLGVDVEDQGDVAGSISGMMKEGARLVDLNWLESAVQDLKRLPEQSVDTMIPELQEAWGTTRRTDGIQVVPNVDYPKVTTNMQNLPGDQIREFVAHAMRRSACGEPIDHILAELYQRTNRKVSVKVAQAIQSEHGLVGNVYIRTTAFPGLLNGRWAELLKKRCASAQYILAPKGSKEAAVDRIMGRKVVTEIPWAEAVETYRPILGVQGKRIASGNPREALKAAFTAPPKKITPREASCPMPTHQMDTETPESARTKLASYVPTSEVIDPTQAILQKDRERLMKLLARWVVAGLLSKDEGRKLIASRAKPQDVLDTAASLVVATGKTPVYSGFGVQAKMLVQGGKDASWAKLREDEVRAHQELQIRERITKMARDGLLSVSDAKEILALGRPAGEMLAMATKKASVSRQTTLQEMGPVGKGPTLKAGFLTEGAVGVDAHMASDPVVQPKSKVASENLIEARKLIRWARQKMSEGAVGKDFDILLKARFSEVILKNASMSLEKLRKAHEGLAGHLYVDASAYASPAGVDGCEAGALRHRANNLKFVLAMDRCASCVNNSQGACQKYGKILVKKADLKDAGDFQQRIIRMADASNAEITASFFEPGYNPGEFDLQNNSLEDISYDDAPTPENLGDILFDGLVIP